MQVFVDTAAIDILGGHIILTIILGISQLGISTIRTYRAEYNNSIQRIFESNRSIHAI